MSKKDDMEKELSDFIDSQRRILNSVYDDFFGPLNVPSGGNDSMSEAKELEKAIEAYNSRDRKYGGLSAKG